MKLRSEVHAFFLCILRENSYKLIVNLKLEIQNFYTAMYWIFIINMNDFVWLLMHAIRLFISILTDFVTSHKIAFYSKLYDIDFLESFTHDRTYITLYVHEFLIRLHQHCFFGQKSPTYYHNISQRHGKLLKCASRESGDKNRKSVSA